MFMFSVAAEANAGDKARSASDVAVPVGAAQAPGRGKGAAPGSSADASEAGEPIDLSSSGKTIGDLLAARGVYLNGGYTGTDLTELVGGNRRGSAFAYDFAYGADFDLQQLLGLSGAQVHVVGDSRFGGVGSGANPFNGAGIGYITGAGPTNGTRLAELTYEQAFLDDHLEMRVGRLSSTLYLTNLTNDCQFVTFVCGQPAGWAFNNAQENWPYATWGAQFTLRPTPTIYVRTGAYEDDAVDIAKSGTPFDGSWNSGHSDGVFLPMEAGYSTTFATDPYPRRYALGFFADTKDFADNRYNAQVNRSP